MNAGFPLPPAPFTGAVRRVPPLRGFDWVHEGWQLFLAAPRQWLMLSSGIVAFCLVCFFCWLRVRTGFAPSMPRKLVLALLFFAPTLVMPLAVAAGLDLCRRLARDETPDGRAGFALLRRERLPLLTIGSVLLAGSLFVHLVYEALHGPLALLFSLLAAFAILLTAWFLTPLTVFHQLPPLLALSRGFAATSANLPAFAAFGFTMAALHFVALLSAGLGLLVLIPVLIGALHTSYRDVFSES